MKLTLCAQIQVAAIYAAPTVQIDGITLNYDSQTTSAMATEVPNTVSTTCQCDAHQIVSFNAGGDARKLELTAKHAAAVLLVQRL